MEIWRSYDRIKNAQFFETRCMYEVSYNGQMSYASNYFYCRIRPEGLLRDAERDLLAIAKFLVLVIL